MGLKYVDVKDAQVSLPKKPHMDQNKIKKGKQKWEKHVL